MNPIIIGGKKPRPLLLEWLYTILWAGGAAILLRSFLLEPFNIPSGSMIPTLQVGDHLVVSKWDFGYSRFSFPFGSFNLWSGRFAKMEQPKRGDIIVFRKPNGSVEWVKRLVALPGETVQMKAGRLYIDGKIVPRENPKRFVVANIPRARRDGFAYKDMFIKGNTITVDGKPADFDYTIEYKDDVLCAYSPMECTIEFAVEYTETLPGGVKHRIIEMSDAAMLDNTAAMTVPPDKYFMMGDNRDRSDDSRGQTLGFVPMDNLIGKVWAVFYSHNYYANLLAAWKWKDKMRWERFGLMPGEK
ncbi:MAG: signal peptidase I [Rickettsiales bacterium]|nr:signal peptidase I [Rickettsiales bacterium]